MIKEERETTVAVTDADDVVRIWTAQPPVLRRLRKHPKVTELEGGEDWGSFTVPSKEWNPVTGIKRASRPMTDEQKAAGAERLRRARETA